MYKKIKNKIKNYATIVVDSLNCAMFISTIAVINITILDLIVHDITNKIILMNFVQDMASLYLLDVLIVDSICYNVLTDI